MFEKPTQLPGLRLDRMVARPVEGEPIETIYDYSIPGTDRISKELQVPSFHYVERVENGQGLNLQGLKVCQYLVRKGTPVKQVRSSYTHVREHVNGNGYTDYTFEPINSFIDNRKTLNMEIDRIHSGQLLSKKVYTESGKLLYKEEHDYINDYTVNQSSSDYRSLTPAAVTLGISFYQVGSWRKTVYPVSDRKEKRQDMRWNLIFIVSTVAGRRKRAR